MKTPEVENLDTSIVQSEPDGRTTINSRGMIVGQRYSFLHRGYEAAVAVLGDDRRIRLVRVFPETRNPITWLVNKWREPIITLPPLSRTED